MSSKKVFIGWSDENKLLADMIAVQLRQAGFMPIVGGGKDTTFMVSEQILEQMNESEMAILLFEKQPESKGNGVSTNIMFEWGYLLHHLPDPTNIRVFLLNMYNNELPSDVVGCWSQRIEKRPYTSETEKAQIFDEVAKAIFDSFFEYAQTAPGVSDKLGFFDDWEENKQYIFHYDGVTRITDKLLYGMQAAIYSDTYERLYETLGDILKKKEDLNEEVSRLVQCVKALLEVFVKTKRLTCPLEENDYDNIMDALEFPYEAKIRDSDLAAWCKIHRIDKQELATEFFAEGLTGEAKREYLEAALEKSYECIDLIDAQVEAHPGDSQFALLYYAFIYRNLFQIHKKLYALDPKDEYIEKQKEYCAVTLEKRGKLYEHYLHDRNTNSIAIDYITQEYILALAEQLEFEESSVKIRKYKNKIQGVYRKWKERNQIRNMIFDKITKQAADFLQ